MKLLQGLNRALLGGAMTVGLFAFTAGDANAWWGYGYRCYGAGCNYRYHHWRHVNYGGCRWINGHYNRFGHWVRGHRTCWR